MTNVEHWIGTWGAERLERNTIRVVHVSTSAVKVNTKVTRTTRGYTWEATVTGAESAGEALRMLKDAEAKLRAEFGQEEG
jgi:hypothetical protein